MNLLSPFQGSVTKIMDEIINEEWYQTNIIIPHNQAALNNHPTLTAFPFINTISTVGSLI